MSGPVELRLLEYVACLADELHFGRAADRLGIAQAALSQQVRQLEERLGVRLFERTTRRVRLTTAGEVLVKHARVLLAGVEQAVSQVRAISGEQTGRLVVGGVHLALSHVLPRIIAEFRRLHPAVTVDVQPVSTAVQMESLRNGLIDIAFIRPTAVPGFMRMETVFKEGFVAVLPRQHPLAARKTVTILECSDHPLVGYAPILGASGYSNEVIDAIRKAGRRPNIVQQVGHTLSVATLVAGGVGIGIVPSWLRHVAVDGVVYRPVADLPESIELVAAWPTDSTSPVVEAFIAVTRRQAASRRGK